jgi:hypothetical protein
VLGMDVDADPSPTRHICHYYKKIIDKGNVSTPSVPHAGKDYGEGMP